jgi:hypothetical protein
MRRGALLFVVMAAVFLISVSCSGEKDQVAEKIRQIVAEETGGEGKIIELEVSDTSMKMGEKGGGVTEVQLSGEKAGYIASIILDYKGVTANIVVAINKDKTSGALDYSALRNALGSY